MAPRLEDRIQQLLSTLDAEFECPHGALPNDRKKPEGCHCWNGNGKAG